jgi:hypothetical protein
MVNTPVLLEDLCEKLRSALPKEVLYVLQAIVPRADWDNKNLWLCFLCPDCNAGPSMCTVASAFQPGTCLQLRCSNDVQTNCNSWFVCMNCHARLKRRRADGHFTTQKHQRNVCSGDAATVITSFTAGVVTLEPSLEPREQRQGMVVVQQRISGHMLLLSKHLVELQEIFSDTPTVCINSMLVNSFQDQDCMRLYHVADLSLKHGGLQYLVARAFQQTIKFSVGAHELEALWHFRNMVQFISMSDKQRRRQAKILQAQILLSGDSPSNSPFPTTWVPSYKEMNRFYGRSNQHTMWRCLPIPTVKSIEGIAYANPLNVIRHLLAFSTEVDLLMVQAGEENQQPSDQKPSNGIVLHVTQSEWAKEWKQQIKAKHPNITAILLWVVDWRDGFGANRTKQNRKSTTAWTLSVATPKERINSLSNTLPIALGLKNNTSWAVVEDQFRHDMSCLGNGLEPFMVYHGGLKKIIPAFVKRVACLTDKVERGDYTATLSCTSIYHRLFGKILRFDAPSFQTQLIEEYLKNTKLGTHDLLLKQYGWSESMVGTEASGGVFPACHNCRKANVDWLRTEQFQPFQNQQQFLPHVVILCEICANWTLSSSTKGRMKFSAPEDYPTTSRCLADCPVSIPTGREPGLEFLHYIDCDFPSLKQAARYAFFNAKSAKTKGWTKKTTKAYLRTCGVNGKQQDLLYEAATRAYKNGTEINWDDPLCVGDFKFPASWAGDLPLKHFIEMIMHLIFLGVAESNFTLCNIHLKGLQRSETFKKRTQHLLKSLTKFNLSWLLAFPFSGQKLTTGTWVSENWLAWIRISKITYAFCIQRGIDDERLGASDLMRMVTSFTAVVARVLSHAGSSNQSCEIIDAHLKEFLSSVREFDIRTRYKNMKGKSTVSSCSGPGGVSGGAANGADSGGADDGGRRADAAVEGSGKKKRAKKSKSKALVVDNDNDTDTQWWLKSNYVSTLNLVETIRHIGPLTNFWDGGGKGEKYIQEIKPHIPRGVRDSGSQFFFVRLMEKVFKMDCLKKIEGTIPDDTKTMGVGIIEEEEGSSTSSLSSASVSTLEPGLAQQVESSLEGEGLPSCLEGLPPPGLPPPTRLPVLIDDIETEEESGNNGSDDESSERSATQGLLDDDPWTTPMESEQMSKARTFYIYKNLEMLHRAYDEQEPLSGIVVSCEGLPKLFVVHRNGRNSFGWKMLSFNDQLGIDVFGMWYAPIKLLDTLHPPPSSIQVLTEQTKMAAMAIPLRFSVEPKYMVDHQNNYCVITNWWRERICGGNYIFPQLVFSHYENPKASV